MTAIERAELLRLMDVGAQVIDVLPEHEYAESHIPGAMNIPLKQLSGSTVSDLRRDRPVVVY